jgi:hypothetical protein
MGKIVPLNNTVTLRGIKTDLGSAAGHAFTVDCCRAGEGLVSDDELRDKYELSQAEFQKISTNKALIRAIRAESQRRVNLGTAAREAAAQKFVKAPQVLDSIMSDSSANPRHRIDAAAQLRTTALGGGDDRNTADTSEKFVISIHLGSDVERFEKTIAPMKPLVPTIEGKIDVDE